MQVVRLPPFQGHEAVQVVPANADPIKTIIESWPPDRAIGTGSSHLMTIVPCDSYGNPGGTGATFTVRLLYGGTNQVTPYCGAGRSWLREAGSHCGSEGSWHTFPPGALRKERDGYFCLQDSCDMCW